MTLKILTPEKTIFEGDAYLVQLPGDDGLFEILHNHAPLISKLSKGKVKVQANKDTKAIFYEINGGVVSVKNNKIVLLTDE